MKGNSLSESEPVFRAVLEGGGVFTLQPRGNSMLPTIRPGRDTVHIVRLEGRANLYDILFYQRPDGRFVLHRVIRVEADSYTLCGDCQVEPEEGVTQDRVIGVVASIQRPDGTLVRGTRAFAVAGRRRLRSLPFRRLRSRIGRLLRGRAR